MGIKKSKTKIFLTNNRIKLKKIRAIIGIQISIVPIIEIILFIKILFLISTIYLLNKISTHIY